MADKSLKNKAPRKSYAPNGGKVMLPKACGYTHKISEVGTIKFPNLPGFCVFLKCPKRLSLLKRAFVFAEIRVPCICCLIIFGVLYNVSI